MSQDMKHLIRVAYYSARRRKTTDTDIAGTNPDCIARNFILIENTALSLFDEQKPLPETLCTFRLSPT